MRAGEIFSSQVCDPVTKLVVTLRDKSFPLTVKGISDIEGGVAAVAVVREFWGI